MNEDAPDSLDMHGQALWRKVVESYDLRVDELVTLADFCAMADELVELDKALVDLGRPYMSTGSMGQEVEHPIRKMRNDLRMKRATLARQLKLPDLDAGAEANQNRDAANASWQPGVRGRGA